MIAFLDPALSSANAPPPRFTLDGDDALESRLLATCQAIMAGIRGLIPRHRLEAVLLGGGYGRGEGGVLNSVEGDLPYNDLEFYVCLRGNRHLNERRHRLSLEVLGEILTPIAGAELEFKITSLAEFRRSRISMFSYDLLMGHRWLLGREEMLLGLAHLGIAGELPLAEATRLLMNRCSGLLFARERLERGEFTAADADFVQRNIAKAELAFGDAVLAAYGQYHWSAGERHRRLQRLSPTATLSWLDEVRRHHAAGLQFKLHPRRSAASRAALRSRLSTVAALGLEVWLWQESRRLGARFDSAREYAASTLNSCPETSRPRNLLVNLKIGGPRSLFKSDPFRHPREKVLRDLCSLLWDPGAPASDLGARVAAYRALWQRVT
jgi:hypothetical protein